MKKKGILALLLACSMFTGVAATAAGCNIVGGGDQQQEDPQKVAVTGVEISENALEIVKGQYGNHTATVKPSNATNKKVGWSSSDPKIADVDANGKVEAKAVGVATITVTTADGGKKAVCQITVKPAPSSSDDDPEDKTVAVTGVSLSAASATLEIDETKKLTETVKPGNATNKNVTWTSSAPDIADVDNSGTVTAKAAGTATITVTTADGGKTATCKITVKEKPVQGGDEPDPTVAVTGVSLSPTSKTLEINDVTQLTATPQALRLNMRFRAVRLPRWIRSLFAQRTQALQGLTWSA